VFYYRCFKAALSAPFSSIQQSKKNARNTRDRCNITVRRDNLSSDWFFWKAKEPIGLLEHEAATRMWE
jgi:hypothetical protein